MFKIQKRTQLEDPVVKLLAGKGLHSARHVRHKAAAHGGRVVQGYVDSRTVDVLVLYTVYVALPL